MDDLSKAISRENISGIWLEPLFGKSIDRVVMFVDPKNNWMTLIKEYILNSLLPTKEQEAHNVYSTAARYVT